MVVPAEGPPDISGFDPELVTALRRIADPCSIATGVPIDLIDMGLVLEARQDGATAHVTLQLTSNVCMQLGIIEAAIHEELGRLTGVAEVQVAIDHQAEWLPTMVAAHPTAALRARRPLPLSVL